MVLAINWLQHLQAARSSIKQEPLEGAGESEAAAPPVAKQRQSAAQRRRQRSRYYSSESSGEDDEEEEDESEEENDAVRPLDLLLPFSFSNVSVGLSSGSAWATLAVSTLIRTG